MAVPMIGPPPIPEKSEPEFIPQPNPDGGKGNVTAFDSPDGPSFSDLLDVINPLQHIPVINTLYQKLTGDKEGAVADVLGGTLYGGVLGLAAAVAGLVIEDTTGKSISDHAIAMFTDDQPTTAVAQNTPTPSVSTPKDKAVDAKLAAAAVQPPPVEAAPVAVVTMSPASTTDGPVQAGDYLVFGAAPAKGVILSSPVLAANTAQDMTAMQVPKAKPVVVAAAAASTEPTRQGDFLVFGDNTTRAASALPTSGMQAPIQSSGQASTQLPAAAQDPSPLAAANLGGEEPRFRAVPRRSGPMTPPSVLPMPTTGPGAVPGARVSASRSSVSNSANVLAATGLTVPTGASGEDAGAGQWFNGAFNQAMDKYQKAARLGQGGAAGLPLPNPAGSAADSLPLN